MEIHDPMVHGGALTQRGGDVGLQPWALENLARSGIPEQRARALGWRHLNSEESRQWLGFETDAMVGKLLIPFFDPRDGKPMFTSDGREFGRCMLERPIAIGTNKPAKYLAPMNGGQHAYILPEVHRAALQNKRVILTEGEKKAVAATDAGSPCIGLCGPYGWFDSGTKTLLPELHPYAVAGFAWTVVWDSDARWNFDFALATTRLREQLQCRQCSLKVVVLPVPWATMGATA